MGALKHWGLRVQPFKVGPDYIDPSYHTAVTGRPSRNLDTWMLPTRSVIEIFSHACQNVDIAIVEGVMGMYDGISGLSGEGSTAHVAEILKIPVVLVVDVFAAARSAGATVLGFREFDRRIHLSGVILNRVASKKHAEWCRESIETATGIPVLGAIPVNEDVRLPERHLGLIPTTEKHDLHFVERITKLIEANIDLEKLLQIATNSPPLPSISDTVYPSKKRENSVTLAVGFDEAFNFYYQDNLDLLTAHGCNLVFFSPLHEETLPGDIDGIYLGGGFPEVMPSMLEANSSMRNSLKKAIDDATPVYGECGGLMYLTQSITNLDGKTFRMIGALDAGTIMTKSLTLNYTEAYVTESNYLSRAGQSVRGHEFHYSRISGLPRDAKFTYRMRAGKGIDGKHDGWKEGGVLASYMHLHFASNLKLARNFVRALEEYRHS